VICTFPGYQSLYEVARSIGCEVTTWMPDETRGWYFDVDDLANSMRTNTRMVVVNFPHNPTGYLPSLQDFEYIIELVRGHQAYLFSDEMYQYLEAERGVTLPSACEKYERAISLSGLSKSYGLPGLRVGWLASQDTELLKRISQFKSYTTICGSAPSEILAIIALQSRSIILRQQNERIRRNLQVLDGFFMDHSDLLVWNRPKAGSICFPRFLMVKNTYDFCEQMVTDTGIMLVPSRLFEYGDHHVRIGFGKENMPEVIERFAAYLDHHFA
jgi:aspartate/methionine/tyrosine aminotransferase